MKFIQAYLSLRGEMKREIFLYGHFFYGHRMGRYFCPDDLEDTDAKKTGALWLLFAFVGMHALFGVFSCGFYPGRQQTIRTEHRFNSPNRLTDTVPVLD